ncbi:MAG: GNAT family N-acetyltransferase [Candidatus Bipolaricaulota bacterium]
MNPLPSEPGALTFHPLTPDRWCDLEALFGLHGAQGGCWCMWWRQTAKEFAAGRGEPNRAALREIVERGEEPGILAYDRNQAVGWVAVAPRSSYARLARSRTLRPIDDQPVWSISCFFVAKTHRRRGVMRALIDAACDAAKARGAEVVEAYPVVPGDDHYPDAFAFTGTLDAFLDAGFTIASRPSERRAVVRRRVAARAV